MHGLIYHAIDIDILIIKKNYILAYILHISTDHLAFNFCGLNRLQISREMTAHYQQPPRNTCTYVESLGGMIYV